MALGQEGYVEVVCNEGAKKPGCIEKDQGNKLMSEGRQKPFPINRDGNDTSRNREH